MAGSSAGFRLPNANEDVRALDCSDLGFEVVSKSDSLEKQRQKVKFYLSLGMVVGVVVDPRTRVVEVCRLGQNEPKILRD